VVTATSGTLTFAPQRIEDGTTQVARAEGGATGTHYPARATVPQPTLQTERLTLGPLADEHFDWEVELESDFEVMRYVSGRPPHTRRS
jgi:hypothetical protein